MENKEGNAIEKMRPRNIYNKMLLVLAKCGVEFFLNENQDFVDINCPACEGSNNTFVFNKYGFVHLKCNHCNTLFVSPRPVETQLDRYYSDYDAPKLWTKILIETNNDRKYLQHVPRIQKLEEILSSTNNRRETLVDIGAGNGNFAKAAAESNLFKKVIAADISEDCIQACNNVGLETFFGKIEEMEENSVDCITFNDLIEHIFNPKTFLEQCYSRLRQDGTLMLSTPNGEGFDFKILKDKTENITPPEHIQYFNPKSISILLESCNFEVLDVSTPGILDFSIIKKQRDENNFDLSKNFEYLDFLYSLHDEVIEKNFQQFLQNSRLSSHMLIYAIKH